MLSVTCHRNSSFGPFSECLAVDGGRSLKWASTVQRNTDTQPASIRAEYSSGLVSEFPKQRARATAHYVRSNQEIPRFCHPIII